MASIDLYVHSQLEIYAVDMNPLRLWHCGHRGGLWVWSREVTPWEVFQKVQREGEGKWGMCTSGGGRIFLLQGGGQWIRPPGVSLEQGVPGPDPGPCPYVRREPPAPSGIHPRAAVGLSLYQSASGIPDELHGMDGSIEWNTHTAETSTLSHCWNNFPASAAPQNLVVCVFATPGRMTTAGVATGAFSSGAWDSLLLQQSLCVGARRGKLGNWKSICFNCRTKKLQSH